MRINLTTPFAEKDAVKALGARWDAAKKVWYITDVADLSPFTRWIPDLEAATKNAKEKVNSLTVEYNKARQAAITTELIEIISGVEALK